MAGKADAHFERALDKARRPQAAAPCLPTGDVRLVNILAAADQASPLSGATRAAAERWDQACDWTDEPSDAAAGARELNCDDSQDSVARELALRPDMTMAELHRAWRRFMWRNHPDRQAGVRLDIATRRAAIANTLVDRARQAIARRLAGR